MQPALISLAVSLGAMLIGNYMLYRKYVRPLKRQYDKLMQMQAKMLNLFVDFEDMADGFEEYVDDTKKELAEVVFEVKRGKDEINAYKEDVLGITDAAAASARRLEELVGIVKGDIDAARQELHSAAQAQHEFERRKMARAQEARPPAMPMPQNVAPMRPKQYSSAKQMQVLQMYGEGIPPAQIARTTGFSKGEVELIIEMKQKES